MADSLKEALPDWMEAQIISFLKKLQDPETGYFYHPQWTKEEVNAHTSRRSRDMSKAVAILNELGSAPTYDTPAGDEGDGIKWDGSNINATPSPVALTGKFSGMSSTKAVSKVLPTASAAIASHLVDDVAFKAYLDNFAAQNAAGKKSFYAIGNTIGSQVYEIVHRDKQLKKEGKNYSLGKILIDWYNEHQDKETGLWDKGVNYDATNALLKIVGTYDTFGTLFPNADLAMESCVTMLTSDDEALTVCYVYNVWYALADLLTNVNKYSTSQSEKQKAADIKKQLLLEAPEMIRISAEKQLKFKYPDGSFSFEAGKSCLTSQGLRVAPIGEGCGDVNATIICMGGTINRALRAMGIKDYAPGYFTKADLLRYIAILEDLGEIIKDDVNVEVQYATFDDQYVGDEPTEVQANVKNGSITVVDRPNGESGDKAVLLSTIADSGDNLKVTCQTGALTASCFVFEGDFMISSADKDSTVMQILMQDSVYMINLVEMNGKIQLLESSSTKWSTAKQQDLMVYPELGEWFNVKIEYYIGDHYSVRIKVYFNEKLIAITDNYMDKTGEKLSGEGTPKDAMDFTSLLCMSTVTADVYVDNLACYKTSDIYKMPSKDKIPPISIDFPDNEEKIYDFDEETLPSDINLVEGDGLVSRETLNGNGALRVNGGTAPAVLRIPINKRTASANCDIFETDLTFDNITTGKVFTITLSEDEALANLLINLELEVYQVEGLIYARLVDAPDGKTASAIAGSEVCIDGGFELRLEYFESELATLVYINDKLMGMSGTVCKYAKKYQANYLTLEGPAFEGGSVYLDNINFEKNVLSFEAATKPDKDRVIYDLNTLPDGASVSGASVTDKGLKLSRTGNSIKLPLNIRGLIVNETLISTVIAPEAGVGSYLAAILDHDGKEIIALELSISESEVKVYEYYYGGRATELGSYKIKNESFVFTMEYFHKEKVCNIKIDDTIVGVTALTYLYDRENCTPAYLSVKQINSGSVIYLSQLYSESSVKLFEKIDYSSQVLPKAEDTMTFEDSSYIGLPRNLTTTLASVGSRVAIKAMMKDGTATKMLVLHTENGGNDSLSIAMNENQKKAGASVAIFEADMLLDTDPTTSDSGVQISLKNGDGKSAWRISVYFEEGKIITADDYKKPTSTYSKEWTSEGALFKLRLEYTVVDGQMIVNIFVNGEYKGTSKRCYQDSPFSADSITEVNFYTVTTAIGNIAIDNVSFYQTNTLTEVPEEDDTDTGDQGGSGDQSGSGTNPPSQGGSDEQGTPDSFDNIGVIPTDPDDSIGFETDGWT
jgi:hypothetical protein